MPQGILLPQVDLLNDCCDFCCVLATLPVLQFAHMAKHMTKAQEQFDKLYISSGEICRDLSVTRASLTYARKRGLVPEPIVVAGTQVYLWERAEVLRNLQAWKIVIQARRGQLKVELTA